MSILEAIILGLIQGLTEFLPISSSGHLALAPWLFGWGEPGLSFTAALHLGTLLAVVVYFRTEIIRMVPAIPLALSNLRPLLGNRELTHPRAADARLGLLIVLGSIPGGIVGLLAQGPIDDFFHSEEHKDRAIVVIAISLALFGILLYAVDRVARHRRGMRDMGYGDALAIGAAQALALVPGVSRSGITLTAGLFRDINRADAARFSFLLGLPLVLIAGGEGLLDLLQDGSGGIGVRALLLGIIASAISGFIAIDGLIRFLQRSNTLVFVVYRVVAAAAVLVLLATGVR